MYLKKTLSLISFALFSLEVSAKPKCWQLEFFHQPQKASDVHGGTLQVKARSQRKPYNNLPHHHPCSSLLIMQLSLAFERGCWWHPPGICRRELSWACTFILMWSSPPSRGRLQIQSIWQERESVNMLTLMQKWLKIPTPFCLFHEPLVQVFTEVSRRNSFRTLYFKTKNALATTQCSICLILYLAKFKGAIHLHSDEAHKHSSQYASSFIATYNMLIWVEGTDTDY